MAEFDDRLIDVAAEEVLLGNIPPEEPQEAAPAATEIEKTAVGIYWTTGRASCALDERIEGIRLT